jgi:hypothetical protein
MDMFTTNISQGRMGNDPHHFGCIIAFALAVERGILFWKND